MLSIANNLSNAQFKKVKLTNKNQSVIDNHLLIIFFSLSLCLFQSLGILASIPAALLILSLLGLLLYLLTRCCDRKQRKPSAQRCQSCSLVIITLMTCAAIGLGK